MPLVLLLVRVVLAAVFAAAAVAKLADRAGSRRAMAAFGVPALFAPFLAVALPLAEVAVSIALLSHSRAWWGAVGALTLLASFMLGIAYNLVRGRRPDCHCFGQLHSEPVGWPTLARNAALAAAAGLVVAQGPGQVGADAFGWLARLTTGGLVALAAVSLLLASFTALAWFTLKLFAQHGRLLIRVEALEARLAPGAVTGEQASALRTETPVPQGLPIGAPAPAFTLPTLSESESSLANMLERPVPVVLMFMDPNCGPCEALLPQVARWQREHNTALTFAILSRGTARENRKKFAHAGLPPVLLQKQNEVSERYSTLATPSAVVVRADGRLGSAVAPGADAIAALVARFTNGGVSAAAPADGTTFVGAPAPSVALKELDGRPLDLREFRGRDALVLFWNPECGFCQRMLPELRAWEERDSPGTPALIVMSSGGADDIRAMELRSVVVLDSDFAAGRAFGASGTPSAVLLDAEGRIASEMAVGAPAVLALAAAVEVPVKSHVKFPSATVAPHMRYSQ